MVLRLLTLIIAFAGLSACGTPTIIHTPASAVVHTGKSLDEVYYDRLPKLPQPLKVVKVWYRDWSALPDRGLATPYDNFRCHEVRQLKALLCAEWQALQAYRSLNFPFIFREKKPWMMVFVYEYTDRSNRGGNRNVYMLRYRPPIQFYHRPRGLEDRPLYERYEPRGKALIG